MNVYASPWSIGAVPAFARVGQQPVTPIGTAVLCDRTCILRSAPSLFAPALQSGGRPITLTGTAPMTVQQITPQGWVNVLAQTSPTTKTGGWIRAVELRTTNGFPLVPPERGAGVPTTEFPGGRFDPRFPTEREGAPIPEPPPPPPPPKTDDELTQANEPEPAKTPTGLERAAEVAVLLSPIWGAFLLSLAFPPPGAR